LEYKTQVVKVNPKYTSQTGNCCGAKDAKSRVSRSQFVCTSCGAVSHADINAANNIMCRGAALVRKRRGTSVEPGTPYPFRGGSTSEVNTNVLPMTINVIVQLVVLCCVKVHCSISWASAKRHS
jgi:hypothetical protein